MYRLLSNPVAVLVVLAGVSLLQASPIPGDANFDNRVDDLDASVLATHWQQSELDWTEGDFTGDGFVNDLDASILATNWQMHADDDPIHAPEPSSFVVWGLIGLTFVLAAWRRRRSCEQQGE